MAKVMTAKVKLQCPGGQATPAPPVGPALGQHGVNIGQFVMQFNERTKEMKGTTIPVEITIYSDRSFEFITKSPPAAVLLKQTAGHRLGLGRAAQDQGRHGHRRAGPQDRRDQVQRPQRPRPRPRLPDHRRHGPEHGDRDQGMRRSANSTTVTRVGESVIQRIRTCPDCRRDRPPADRSAGLSDHGGSPPERSATLAVSLEALSRLAAEG